MTAARCLGGSLTSVCDPALVGWQLSLVIQGYHNTHVGRRIVLLGRGPHNLVAISSCSRFSSISSSFISSNMVDGARDPNSANPLTLSIVEEDEQVLVDLTPSVIMLVFSSPMVGWILGPGPARLGP